MTSQFTEIVVTRDQFVRMQERHLRVMVESHDRHEDHEAACRSGDVMEAMPHVAVVLVMLVFVRCIVIRRRR